MKLKEILIANGVEETLADKIISENKIYSQAQVDDIANQARKTVQEKMESQFNEKISSLEKDYIQLQNQVRQKEIKDFYTKNGGKEEFFEDFVKINGDNLKDNESIQTSMYRTPWCLKDRTISEKGLVSKEPTPGSESDFDQLFEDVQNGKVNFFE